ncbi:Adenylyl cyclase class-3/4/guanylyl cyclase [Pseudocohnilembus persalinus]|uniref:adenylate cyclase n=1 Tax=Pseudocohnilembus persalinus TaxID=266149 RepID=A0A0V0QWW6_PSEPJ|nr:Adenylyl cyclase class-3/4/guanylyl cyclase [Pseudocohnilembus persalinus]|eukprot:KRX06889.1 Adenylyl cyclase class-3/4/guanylyl cyclase [Pseudocohnilembus persalinus]
MSSVDEFEMVSVLQADIKGFTAYSNQMQNPRACVQLLQRLYEGFDRLCVEYNLFKLYTVGDCYVVLGFNNANKRGPQTYQQEAYNLTKMGLEMIKHIEQVKAEIKFDQLGMRVGIHTGTIVGGIIGTEVVRYDIYGKDAYITALMESEGFEEIMKNGEVIKKVNQLHISEKTKELLEKNNKQHNFEFRQHLDLDGKVAEIDISKYTKDDPEEPQNMKGYFVKEIHK